MQQAGVSVGTTNGHLGTTINQPVFQTLVMRVGRKTQESPLPEGTSVVLIDKNQRFLIGDQTISFFELDGQVVERVSYITRSVKGKKGPGTLGWMIQVTSPSDKPTMLADVFFPAEAFRRA